MDHKVRRIDLAATADLEAEITSLCDVQHGAGFVLASTFVFGTQLVLIFRKQ